MKLLIKCAIMTTVKIRHAVKLTVVGRRLAALAQCKVPALLPVGGLLTDSQCLVE